LALRIAEANVAAGVFDFPNGRELRIAHQALIARCLRGAEFFGRRQSIAIDVDRRGRARRQRGRFHSDGIGRLAELLELPPRRARRANDLDLLAIAVEDARLRPTLRLDDDVLTGRLRSRDLARSLWDQAAWRACQDRESEDDRGVHD